MHILWTTLPAKSSDFALCRALMRFACPYPFIIHYHFNAMETSYCIILDSLVGDVKPFKHSFNASYELLCHTWPRQILNICCTMNDVERGINELRGFNKLQSSNYPHYVELTPWHFKTYFYFLPQKYVVHIYCYTVDHWRFPVILIVSCELCLFVCGGKEIFKLELIK